MTGDGAREAGDFWNDLEGTVHRADDGEALLESEQRFKFLWEHSVVAGALTLPTGEVEVNDAFCEMLGYKREELVNKVTWMQLTHPQDVEETQRQVDAILSGEKASVRFEKRYLRKDGGVVWTDLSSSVRRNDAGEPLYLMTTMVDITERKRAASSAKEDQRRIENLLATAPFQIWSFNGETYDFVNREYLSFTGLEIEGPLTPETWTAYVHPDDLEKAGEIWQKAWEAKAEHDNYFRLRRSDGVYRDFWCHAAPILDDAGELERFQGYNIDITDRKHAEEALAASSASHFAILQTAMDGFWLVDTDGRLLEVNEAYCRESGYSEQELLTMNIADLVSPGTIEDVGPRIQRAVAEGGLRFEAQPRRKDGSVFDAEVSVQYQSAGGGSIAAFIHDVTERKRSEEALREFVTSIVDVIGNVSEMRDPYTAGHQRRVAEL
ncbi:MAG: PAS domain S-box protein, partial [Coriobacteriia bacterium]